MWRCKGGFIFIFPKLKQAPGDKMMSWEDTPPVNGGTAAQIHVCSFRFVFFKQRTHFFQRSKAFPGKVGCTCLLWSSVRGSVKPPSPPHLNGTWFERHYAFPRHLTVLPISRREDATGFCSFVLHRLVAFHELHCDAKPLGQIITGLGSVVWTWFLLGALSPFPSLLSLNSWGSVMTLCTPLSRFALSHYQSHVSFLHITFLPSLFIHLLATYQIKLR